MTTAREGSMEVAKILNLYENDLKNQLKLGKNSELFDLIHTISKNEFDPTKSSPIHIFHFPHFIDLLDEKVKKCYLYKTANTVFEYIDDKQEKRACLVNYIALEACIKNEEDIELCLARLARLFEFLVYNTKVLATMDQAMAIPYTDLSKKDTVCFSLWLAIENSDKYNHPFKELNEIVGFDVFVNEGSTISNFDWTLIDKLK